MFLSLPLFSTEGNGTFQYGMHAKPGVLIKELNTKYDLGTPGYRFPRLLGRFSEITLHNHLHISQNIEINIKGILIMIKNDNF